MDWNQVVHIYIMKLGLKPLDAEHIIVRLGENTAAFITSVWSWDTVHESLELQMECFHFVWFRVYLGANAIFSW
jgi:hypothetical protein